MSRLASLFRSFLQPKRRSAVRRCLGVELLEDRLVPSSSPAVNFSVTQDWGTGFQAQLAITNPAAGADVPDWKLEFHYADRITDIWDAKVLSHVGDDYVIGNAGWNSDLSPGSTVSFGFIGGSGSAQAQPSGYLLDGVPLGGATPALPSLSIGNVTVTEPASGTVIAQFPLTLSAPATGNVTVQWQTADGTAHAGTDYQAASGTLTFAPGQTQQTIAVTVDAHATSDETFTVDLSSLSGATLGTSVGTGTIHYNPPPPSGSVQFQVTSDWGSGFTGSVTIPNSAPSPVANWQLQFTFNGQISSIWNAQIVNHSGSTYVVEGASWNSTIPANGSVSFGFNGSPGNVTTATGLTNFVLLGTGGTTNTPPTAANDTAFTLQNQAVNISVLANDSDPDGDTLSVASVGTAAHGTLVLNSNNTVTYTPATGFLGTDRFTYTVSDGHGNAASASVSVTVSAPATSGAWPQNVFAPYVDVTAWPTFNFLQTAQTEGTRFFSLAFVVAGPNKEPAWGGYQAYDVGNSSFSASLATEINQLRAMGGDVAVSFGGAANQELALVYTNVTALTAAYQSVIDAYGLTRIDFDIEGAAVADHASIDLRSQAIAALQQQAAAVGKTLQVTFTLPVLPTGLTSDGLYVLQSALKYGVNITGVNVMAMDYGDSAAPNPSGQMGTYAIDAATSLFNQLQTLYGTQKTAAQLWQMVGVTPMIGVNDVSDEVFTQQDARQLLAFARQHNIGELSMWSLNRDQPGDSGITQQSYDFSNIFEPFTG